MYPICSFLYVTIAHEFIVVSLFCATEIRQEVVIGPVEINTFTDVVMRLNFLLVSSAMFGVLAAIASTANAADLNSKLKGDFAATYTVICAGGGGFTNIS